MKAELVKMMDKYNAQLRKYADHKLAMKNKLHCIKSVAFVHLLLIMDLLTLKIVSFSNHESLCNLLKSRLKTFLLCIQMTVT